MAIRLENARYGSVRFEDVRYGEPSLFLVLMSELVWVPPEIELADGFRPSLSPSVLTSELVWVPSASPEIEHAAVPLL